MGPQSKSSHSVSIDVGLVKSCVMVSRVYDIFLYTVNIGKLFFPDMENDVVLHSYLMLWFWGKVLYKSI